MIEFGLFIFTTILILGLRYVLQQLRQYYIDLYRSEIFKLRDELFLYASDGKISFSSLVYKETRQLLNGYIRTAEHFNIIAFYYFAWSIQKEKITFKSDNLKKYDKALKNLPDEQSQFIKNILFEASKQTHILMRKNSPIWAFFLRILISLQHRLGGRKIFNTKDKKTEYGYIFENDTQESRLKYS